MFGMLFNFRYRNIYCAQCHGVAGNLKFWKGDIGCNRLLNDSCRNFGAFSGQLNPILNPTLKELLDNSRYVAPQDVWQKNDILAITSPQHYMNQQPSNCIWNALREPNKWQDGWYQFNNLKVLTIETFGMPTAQHIGSAAVKAKIWWLPPIQNLSFGSSLGAN